MIVDRIENAGLYSGINSNIAAVLDAIANRDFTGQEKGRIPDIGLKDQWYLSVLEYQTRKPDISRWEAHRLYVDIQYIAQGTESIGHANIRDMELSEPYDSQNDRWFFRGNGQFFTLPQGWFAIFFPEDAHLACAWLNETPQNVRKILGKAHL